MLLPGELGGAALSPPWTFAQAVFPAWLILASACPSLYGLKSLLTGVSVNPSLSHHVLTTALFPELSLWLHVLPLPEQLMEWAVRLLSCLPAMAALLLPLACWVTLDK